MGSVFDDLLYPQEVLESFAAAHCVATMLRIESALAQAQAQHGLIPHEAAVSIAGTCKIELFDTSKIVRSGMTSGNLARSFLKELREAVGLFNPQAAPFVHHGCSEMDLSQTAMALMTQRALICIQQHGQTCVSQLAQRDPPAARSLERLLQDLQQHTQEALVLHCAMPSSTPHAVQAQLAMELGLSSAPQAFGTVRQAWLALACDVARLSKLLGELARSVPMLAPTGEAAIGLRLAASIARHAPQRLAALLAPSTEDDAPHPVDWLVAQSEWTPLFMGAHSSALVLSKIL